MTTTCERKQRYASHGLAQKSATRQSRESGDVIQPYSCTDCGGWHIGHPRLGPDRGARRPRRGRG
jgi:hypothetical protein